MNSTNWRMYRCWLKTKLQAVCENGIGLCMSMDDQERWPGVLKVAVFKLGGTIPVTSYCLPNFLNKTKPINFILICIQMVPIILNNELFL